MPSSNFPSQSMTIRSKVLLGFGIVLAMFVVIAWVSISSTRGFIGTAEHVAEAQEVLAVQERLLGRVMEMESCRRGFIATGNEKMLDDYGPAQTAIMSSFAFLKQLRREQPEQMGRLEQLNPLLEQSFSLQADEITLVRREGRAAAARLLESGRTEVVIDRIREVLREFETSERELLEKQDSRRNTIARVTTGVVATGGTFTFLALVTACILILKDIAARRKAEEALAEEHNLLSSIINAMPNYVYVKDLRGRYIMDNTAHRHYLGVDEITAVEGRTVYDYFTPLVAEQFSEDDREVFETGEPIINREEPAMTLARNPREMWLETTKVPLRDTDGRIIGLVGISSDISERKEAEEKLRRFASQLERSNAELQNFASVASHDLQEPLRKIQAFGDRLKAKCGPQLGEQGLDYLARMQNAAHRMQVLIQDLLKLSRVTSRAQPFEPCDLGEIVTAVLSDLEVTIEQTQALVEVGELPVIDADPVQMRQLFQNLIANALKFHREGVPPAVHISGRVFTMHEHLIPGGSPGDEICQIYVQDNGIGFDEKFANQIFVVFQRLHSRQEYEGTGIGLAVCRKITDRHGGSIVAKSAEGQGATFIVTLPVKQLRNPSHE